MNSVDVFGNDPWQIILIKLAVLVVFLLCFAIFSVWFERRVVAKMQQRKGPIMNGPFGLPQGLADGLKLLFKEDFRPKGADRVLFTLAPIITGTAAFTAWSVIPVGGQIKVCTDCFGREGDVFTQLQLTDLPMGVLFILSIAAIGIYGIILAGWVSTSKYSLLGSIRSTAQMISYEVSMGLSLVAVFMYASSMSTSDIVESQMHTWSVWSAPQFPSWNAILLFPSFVIYVISMVAETNRAPFDLVECEQELVSGYITDYSGFRYAVYFLAEYINMSTVSAVATTLFLGGYHAPWPLLPWLNDSVPWIDAAWMGPIWFLLKVTGFMFLFIWLRGTLPRLRYDQFMHLGWKYLVPVSLVWILVVAFVQVATNQGWITQQVISVAFGVALVLVLIMVFIPSKPAEVRSEVSRVPTLEDGEFDAFADGYPVPPMPGQVLVDDGGQV